MDINYKNSKQTQSHIYRDRFTCSLSHSVARCVCQCWYGPYIHKCSYGSWHWQGCCSKMWQRKHTQALFMSLRLS